MFSSNKIIFDIGKMRRNIFVSFIFYLFFYSMITHTQKVIKLNFAFQVTLLKSWGYKEVHCVSKTLMCGDTGMGAMAEVDTIVQSTLRALTPSWDSFDPPF